MSPIRPENRGKYPANWAELRAAVLERARLDFTHAAEHDGKPCCECWGECGHDHLGRCEAPQGAWIYRFKDAPGEFRGAPAPGEDGCHPETPDDCRPRVQVVLTTAHLCQDEACADLEHLRGMCQLCHLSLDRDRHAATRAETRRQAAAAAGQQPLFPEVC